MAGEERLIVISRRWSAKAAGETPAGKPAGCRRYKTVRYPAAGMLSASEHFLLEDSPTATVLRLQSSDGMNRLTQACVRSLIDAIEVLSYTPKPLIITGNSKFFSVGADLAEIAALTGPVAFEFSKMGQRLMNAIEQFPAPVYAAIEGYCMGGGLDLALACHRRIASPHAVFAHRGAALGLITGWGGTQRLPRLIGKSRALAMLVAAEKLRAADARKTGLVDAVVEDPVVEALRRIEIAVRNGF